MSVRIVFIFLILCSSIQATVAAEFRVPKKEWEALSAAERAAIEKNLVRNRLMLPGDKIVGVEGAAVGAWDIGCELKRAACDVAAAAAAAACTGSAPAVAICLAAVAAARDECRKC